MEYLEKLSREGFYGNVEIQFSNGQVVLVREAKTLKPEFFVISVKI